MPEPSFANSLLTCDDATSLTLAGGNRFIRKLPDKRPLGYLHKLHSPLSETQLRTLPDVIEHRLSAEFEDFLRWSNGASLFDNNILLFGLVDRIERSVALDTQQPISIKMMNEELRAEHGGRWSDGWRTVGAILGQNRNVSIELNTDGVCTLRSGDYTFSAGSFDRSVNTIIDRLGTCFNCDGIVDGTYAELDAALASLFRLQ